MSNNSNQNKQLIDGEVMFHTLKTIDSIHTKLNDVLSKELLLMFEQTKGVFNFVTLLESHTFDSKDFKQFKCLFYVEIDGEFELELYEFDYDSRREFVTKKDFTFDKLYNYRNKDKISLDKLTFNQVFEMINLIQKQVLKISHENENIISNQK